MHGDEQPQITKDIVGNIKTKPRLPTQERADRLLRLIAKLSQPVGTPYEIRREAPAIFAWSESTEKEEIGYLTHFLINRGWLDARPNIRYLPFGDYNIPAFVRVTVEGDSHIAAQRINTDIAQALVAMWFDDSMNEAYEKGIKPAIEQAGYNPFKISEKPDVDKIDDEIIGEIRRSRFLVADFTHGAKGARGGVYYEAGFAYGLGLHVVRSCRKDIIDKNELHFDVRQHYHVVWETVNELRDGLEKRIRALVGEGPR